MRPASPAGTPCDRCGATGPQVRESIGDGCHWHNCEPKCGAAQKCGECASMWDARFGLTHEPECPVLASGLRDAKAAWDRRAVPASGSAPVGAETREGALRAVLEKWKHAPVGSPGFQKDLLGALAVPAAASASEDDVRLLESVADWYEAQTFGPPEMQIPNEVPASLRDLARRLAARVPQEGGDNG